ncbi:MAG: nucleotidyl transferase AbiEii/AbiGii toxin family protein [Myxococcota bacterium]
MRLTLEARLGTARIPLQVDVGFGDAMAVPASPVELPSLLPEQPRAAIRAYSREVVVAEKLHAIVQRGLANTRMKDYFDLVVLAERFDFDGALLADAIAATFARRRTPLLARCPEGLADAFAVDATKLKQWAAFLRRSGLEPRELQAVVRAVRAFVLPVSGQVEGERSYGVWLAGGRWQAESETLDDDEEGA